MGTRELTHPHRMWAMTKCAKCSVMCRYVETINLVHHIVGNLLYYSIAVDPTMIAILDSIYAQQAKVTEQTYVDTLWLLNYSAMHHDATIRYTASDMVLHIHSDASYLSKP